MLVLRSLLFNVAFYANLALWSLAAVPCFVLPRRATVEVLRAWSRSSMWLLRVIAGTGVEFRHLERVPPGGLLVAAKHQSMFETFALFAVFDDPAFILKRELMLVPFFGWYARKAGMIPVDRRGGTRALADVGRRAAAAVAAGRQAIIFPEGTRREPGAPPAYKSGATFLYGALGVPCLPVALNSGLFWPRRRFVRRPGAIAVEMLEPIAPGLPRKAFAAELQARIETASDRLLDDAGGPPAAAPATSAA